MHATGSICLTLMLVVSISSQACAEVRLPAVIGDHMVLQHGTELNFWGWAEAGESVSVTVAGKSVATTAAAEGRWTVRHAPLQKMGPVDVVIAGQNTITLKNVVCGDVWFCSGQSNMQWRVLESTGAKEEIAAARHPNLRLFLVERQTALQPQADVEGRWVECSPETIAESSAVAYFFGRDLQAALNGRPLGLIQAAYGGCGAEAWVSDATLRADPLYQPLLEKAAAANRDPSQANTPNRASVLYNGVIAPLQHFAIKGVIWYQGEQNVSRAHQYRTLFPAMIRDWRKTWGLGDFPFLFVQLPNYQPDKSKPDRPAEPEASAWAELRDAQRQALQAPHTAMAVTIDIGDPREIHPKNKLEVGRRLAQLALALAHGQDHIASGPLYRSHTIMNGTIHLQFSQVGSGLVARGGELKGFAIAGADQKFVWARARIEGPDIIVEADTVAQPVAVRYAWADNPEATLFNEDGYPASPFRTDDWPGITIHTQR